MHVAAAKGNEKLVDYLLLKMANPHAVDAQGKLPSEYAANADIKQRLEFEMRKKPTLFSLFEVSDRSR